jgi:hypothetical protein
VACAWEVEGKAESDMIKSKTEISTEGSPASNVTHTHFTFNAFIREDEESCIRSVTE